LVADDWNSTPSKGILTQSVVVMVVRSGNPKNIQTWDDLVKSGVKIITPNPASSGSAKWNILAAYGHVLADGGSEADASAYLTKFFNNVEALPGSGRDATTAFQSGQGDVLLSYENEAILARQSGTDFDYVVPPETLLIQNPGAVTTDAAPAAKKFLEYLTGTEAQTDYAEEGFRPLDDSIKVEVDGANDPSDPFPAPSKKLLTIDDDFGGWSEANTKFFDENDGLVTKIQKETGKES
jgi:sulfate transport system substrate-binding protein